MTLEVDAAKIILSASALNFLARIPTGSWEWSLTREIYSSGGVSI